MDSVSEKDEDVFDALMNKIGTNGRFQYKFNLLFNMAIIILYSLPCFNIVIAMTVPDHWCHVPGRNETNFTEEDWKKLTIPLESDGYSYSKCRMYNFPEGITEQVYTQNTSLSETDCQHGWEYDTTWYELTVPSEENWVCQDKLRTTNSLFFSRVGEAVGSLIFGHLGDIIGRRPVMFLAAATMVLGRLMSVFTSGVYYLFLVSCLIGNAPVATVFVSPLIIGVEISCKEQRAYIAMLQCVGWTVGICLLPVVAWITGGEWKLFMLATSVPALAVFLLYKLFPESPRWLASKGKYKQCERVLRQISNVNGEFLSDDTLNLLQNMEQNKETVYGVASLFSSWRLAKNSLLMWTCVFLCHLIYYTIMLIVTSMSGNPYLNFFLQAIVELPAFLIGKSVCDRIGRRWTHSTSYVIASVSLIVMAIIVKTSHLQWLLTILVALVKFLVSIGIYVSYLLSTEIYPTCVRQTASSVGFVTSGSLAVVAPYIAYMGSAVDVKYPYIILAILAMVGAISSLFLPETLNQKLADTLADAATFGSDQKFWSISQRKSKEESKYTYD